MSIFENAKSVKEVKGATLNDVPDFVFSSQQPILLRGLVSNWKAVELGLTSAKDLAEYFKSFCCGVKAGCFYGKPENSGRYFYKEGFTELNFQQKMSELDTVIDSIVDVADDAHPPSYYIGSANIDKVLPGLRKHNDIQAIQKFNPVASIWISNQSRIAAHFDMPLNIACCVAGKRRFSVFPPDQLANLYIGSLDITPAGQAISLVDFYEPDFAQYPKFEKALEFMQVAELEPGDALFLPSMWWHHVEGLSKFNVLVNYWWSHAPAYAGAPIDALHHALLNIKDLSCEQKKAWRALFDYYVFNEDESAFDHIPDAALGRLGKITDLQARYVRSQLLNKLNR